VTKNGLCMTIRNAKELEERVKWKWSSSGKPWITPKEDSFFRDRYDRIARYTIFWAIPRRVKRLMLTNTVNNLICMQQFKKNGQV